MNIRLSAGSVRVRLTEEESRRLSAAKTLQEDLMLPDGKYSLRVQLEDSLEQTLSFSLGNGLALTKVRTADFLELISAKQSKASGLKQYTGDAADSLCLQLEIDLFSLKKQGPK